MRGCGCIEHPAFPAPSEFQMASHDAKLARITRRDRGGVGEAGRYVCGNCTGVLRTVQRHRRSSSLPTKVGRTRKSEPSLREANAMKQSTLLVVDRFPGVRHDKLECLREWSEMVVSHLQSVTRMSDGLHIRNRILVVRLLREQHRVGCIHGVGAVDH